jgi:hypothetical protein
VRFCNADIFEKYLKSPPRHKGERVRFHVLNTSTRVPRWSAAPARDQTRSHLNLKEK